MGTKTHPGEHDCYDAALPDEPVFAVLGRDPSFEAVVLEWIRRREELIMMGLKGPEDHARIDEAYESIAEARRWRRENDGKWRGDGK